MSPVGGSLTGPGINRDVSNNIKDYEDSYLRGLVDQTGFPLAIKFVSARWASHYATSRPLNISNTPALTWGTGAYVTPLACPLSSVLYGRIGVVADFDPKGWRVFDATIPAARRAYLRWVQAQPNYEDLVLTVHSTYTNHRLRNKFRRQFRIDCVLFYPDQEADVHTDISQDVWMLVTDWSGSRIQTTLSKRLSNARFTVLIDEEFDLIDTGGLPIQVAKRKIEPTTTGFPGQTCVNVPTARNDASFGRTIAQHYARGDYIHVYIEP